MLEYFLDTDINNAINGRITSVIIIVLDRYYIVYTHTNTHRYTRSAIRPSDCLTWLELHFGLM